MAVLMLIRPGHDMGSLLTTIKKKKVKLYFSSRRWDFCLNFKLFCTVQIRNYLFRLYCLYEIMMRSYMFSWITMHFVSSYLESFCIFDDKPNSSKENAPPPHFVNDPKIYPIVVSKMISYVRLYCLNIIFVDIAHV